MSGVETLCANAHYRASLLFCRAHNFFDKILNIRLRGSNIALQITDSNLLCAQLCAKQKLCLSYNFCHYKLCELNSEDIYTIKHLEEENYIEKDQNCIYGGMQHDTTPHCTQQGVTKNVQNDINPGLDIFCNF